MGDMTDLVNDETPDDFPCWYTDKKKRGGHKMLTSKMIKFLDAHRGSDLIISVSKFRDAFGLDHKTTNKLVSKWMDIKEGNQ